MVSLYFVGLTLFALIMFVAIAFISFYGIKSLFPHSGDAARVAISFSEMLRTYGQITIGLFVILALVALMMEGRVASETAMPIISLISGYILGTSVEGRFRGEKGLS